jgi:hypothetical protein
VSKLQPAAHTVGNDRLGLHFSDFLQQRAAHARDFSWNSALNPKLPPMPQHSRSLTDSTVSPGSASGVRGRVARFSTPAGAGGKIGHTPGHGIKAGVKLPLGMESGQRLPGIVEILGNANFPPTLNSAKVRTLPDYQV